ncbi:MAG: tRNA lysidine(34) synthetase TilS, partial [Cellvibrionaceae bacterium]|nr:tRNA lysidine(34) synthetase TilS [Cellvibrionaceae bacterium]
MSLSPPASRSLSTLAQHCLGQWQSLLAAAEQGAIKRLYLGFSGGLDSTVLLALLAELKAGPWAELELRALHINHGLSPNADQWAEHCAAIAAQHGIECALEKVALAQGMGLEAAAREARYQVFAKHLDANSALLLAHHRQDQAETLLLRLLRGAGPKGLGAMAPRRELGGRPLLRPLLDIDRAELEAYAQQRNLAWIDDESNGDESLERNYLRRQIMPLLEARWPGFGERWGASAQLCREASERLEALAQQQLKACDWRAEKLGQSIELAPLQALDRPAQQQLLRQWLQAGQYPLPSGAQLGEIEQQLIAGRADSEAQVDTQAASLASYRGRLYLWPKGADCAPDACQWHTSGPLNLAGGWQLVAEPTDPALGGGLWLPAEVQVAPRPASGGLRAHPQGRGHSQSLKKLLQEYRIPPWLRRA